MLHRYIKTNAYTHNDGYTLSNLYSWKESPYSSYNIKFI